MLGRNIIILIAMIAVCSFIAANYLSKSATQDAIASEAESAESGTSESADVVIESSLDLDKLKTQAQETPLKVNVPEDAVDIAPIIYGDKDAPIRIEEFASFSCVHCANFHREHLPKIEKALLDSGAVQLRSYSFVRNPADIQATMLVQCQETAEARKKFTEAIFRGQEQWLQEDFEPGLKTIAKVGGMSEDAFAECTSDEALMDRIISSRQWFDKQVKVDATPYFRVGGQVVKGARDVSVFEDAITSALAEARLNAKKQ